MKLVNSSCIGRRQLRLATWFTSIAAAALLTACGSSDSNLTPDPLASFKNQKLDWQVCVPTILGEEGNAMMESASVTLAQFGDDLRCTMMRAPINYAEPEQGELQVALMRVSVNSGFINIT